MANKKVVNASDEAIELAEKAGIDINSIKGTGTKGTVTVPNVEKAIKARDKGGKKGKFYYFVYRPAYRSDKEMLARGVYLASKRIERLDKMPDYIVASYEGKVPDEVVLATANSLGVRVKDAKGKMRSGDDLLAEMSQELK